MCVYPFGKQLEVENVNKQTFNLKEKKMLAYPINIAFKIYHF